MENLNLFEVEASGATGLNNSNPAGETSVLNAQSLSSIIVSLKVNSDDSLMVKTNDAYGRLVEILQSPQVSILLRAAQELAKQQGLQPEEALRSTVKCLKDLDQLWSQVLLKEGLARLSTQFH